MAGFRTIEVTEGGEDLPREIGVRIGDLPGELASVPAAFGPSVPVEGIKAKLVIGDPVLGHKDFTNAVQLRGAVVFLQRGKVGFAS